MGKGFRFLNRDLGIDTLFHLIYDSAQSKNGIKKGVGMRRKKERGFAFLVQKTVIFENGKRRSMR